MKKTLFDLVSDKALSLMGDLRIETFRYPGNPTGKITGISRSFKELVVDLDGIGNTLLLADNYLGNYRYSQFPDGIKAELTAAGREHLEISPLNTAELLKLGDVTTSDHAFAIALKKSPKYVAWEMIKSVNALVYAQHKCDEDGSRFFIKASTFRGVFTANAPAQFLNSAPNGLSLDRLPISPSAAIAIARESIPAFIKAHHPAFDDVDYASLDDDELYSHYLIGAIHKNFLDTDHLPRKYLDHRGNWVDGIADAVAIKETFSAETGRRIDPVEIWASFLAGHVPDNYVPKFVNAKSFAPAQQEEEQPGMR